MAEFAVVFLGFMFLLYSQFLFLLIGSRPA